MRLCIDCRWIPPDDQGDPDFADSSDPSATKTVINPVDGSESILLWRCTIFRSTGEGCGPDAVLWEPKDDTLVGFVWD